LAETEILTLDRMAIEAAGPSAICVMCFAHTRSNYNGARTHLSLAKDSPLPRSVQAVGSILPLPVLGGLHHHYVRI
jgi:hypothetical protein